MATTKISSKLELKVIIALYTVEEVQSMIESGSMLALLQESANDYNEGHVDIAARTFKHNIDSLVCRSKAALDSGAYAPMASKSLKIGHLLCDFTREIAGIGKAGKVQAKYSIEDINEITDLNVAQKVYDSLASVKRDAKNAIDQNAYEDACARFDAASRKRKELKAMASPKQVITASAEKISELKALGLSNAKIQKVLELLNK